MSRVFRIIEETRQVEAVEMKSCIADGAEVQIQKLHG